MIMGPICTANPPPKQWPKTGAEVSRKNFEAFSLKWPFLVSKFLSVAGEGLVLGWSQNGQTCGGGPPKTPFVLPMLLVLFCFSCETGRIC